MTDARAKAAAPRLAMRGVTKRYGGVHALSGVDLEVEAGEVFAVLGENGAGKSTLMKVLSGAVRPDAGTLALDGAPFAPDAPAAARSAGVAMIYQELSLCPHLSVLDNVTLGIEASRRGIRSRGPEAERLGAVLERLGIDSFGPRTPVRDLGPGDRQLVEIARALYGDARVVVFDEPTSSLTPGDAARLMDVARGLARSGVAVLWISHFLEEVRALCGRFVVLRDGEAVARGDVKDETEASLAALMVGRSLAEVYPRSAHAPGEVALSVRNARRADRTVQSASFDLRRGEVLGIFGLVGAGRTELLRAVFGLDRGRFDELRVGGAPVARPNPRASIARGVGLLSEDRAHEGVALDLSIADNVTLSVLGRLAGRGGTLSPRAKSAEAERQGARLALKYGSVHDAARTLSGGNQQKVALARLLASDADVLLLDEPTRGIDVGAKMEVYRLLDELARDGRAVLVSSSYLPEVLGVADRIAVMRRGVLGEARPRAEWTDDEIMRAATTEQEVARG